MGGAEGRCVIIWWEKVYYYAIEEITIEERRELTEHETGEEGLL